MPSKTKKKSADSVTTKVQVEVIETKSEQVTLEISQSEDEEEEMAAAAGKSKSASDSNAALAAATSGPDMSASFKNFRHHPDMENFYRFIYENDLRFEALEILDQVMLERSNRKEIKTAKALAH